MIGTVLDSIVASALTSGLLVGCVTWLGKVWANPILEQDRVKYTKELEQLRNDFETTRRMLQGELDKTIHAHRVQFETEFQILKEIWGKLAVLRTAIAETRPRIDGLIPGETRKERLDRRLETLKHAIVDFMHAMDDHSPFYPQDIFRELEGALKCARAHYRTTGIRDLAEAGARFRHLDLFFRGRRLAEISGATATQYVAQRQAEGAANGTINREVGVLLKLMHLAHEHNKLHRVPKIRTLKEAPPRQGFFETDQFLAVRARLPEDLQVAVSLAFELGWRMPSEVLTLERRQLDVAAGAIRLEPGSTKNDDGRMVYVTPGLRSLLVGQVARVEALQRRLDPIVPYLFPHLRKGMLAGKRRRNFTKAWQRACREAGVPGMLRHDFRRTAVRNMVNAGVPEARRHEGDGTQDTQRVRSVPYREPGRLTGRGPAADGHNSGHTEPGMGRGRVAQRRNTIDWAAVACPRACWPSWPRRRARARSRRASARRCPLRMRPSSRGPSCSTPSSR